MNECRIVLSSYLVSGCGIKCHWFPFGLGNGCENWGLDQLGLQRPLAGGAVEQNRIAVSFPDCGQLDASGAVQAKEDATGPLATNQNAFGHLERAALEFVLVAKGLVDISSLVVQVVELERESRHWGRRLLKNDA